VFSGFMRNPPALHRYLYAESDPVNRIDPTGYISLYEQMTAVDVFGILLDTTSPRLGFRCAVDSLQVSPEGWLGRFSMVGVGELYLVVRFDLKLRAGVSKHDCVIDQDVRGTISWYGGSPMHSPRWEPDPGSDIDWWDGEQWAAMVDEVDPSAPPWVMLYRPDWHGNSATFYDAPGLGLVTLPVFPVLYDQSFRTMIRDRWTRIVVRDIKWGVYFEYSNPMEGRRFFYSW